MPVTIVNGIPRVRPPDHERLPDPLPAQAEPLARRPDGTIADSETAKKLGAKGGLARAQKRRMLQGLGLAELADDNEFKPYYTWAQEWMNQELDRVAQMSGGSIGPGPAALIGGAAMSVALSRYFADKAVTTGDISYHKHTLKWLEAVKQQTVMAFDLAVKQGKAFAATTQDDPFANLMDAANDE